jgi:hypothetical protein
MDLSNILVSGDPDYSKDSGNASMDDAIPLEFDMAAYESRTNGQDQSASDFQNDSTAKVI